MRIISRFKDYYDSAQGMGQDPNLIYVRHTKELKYPDHNNKLDSEAYRYALKIKMPPHNYKVCHGVVAFCGKLYPYFLISDGCGRKAKYYFNINEFKKELKIRANYDTKQYKKFGGIYHTDYKSLLNQLDINCSKKQYNWWHNDYTKLTLKSWSEYLTQDLSVPNDVHLYYDSPIIVKEHYSKTKLIINPNLDKMGFAKIKDSWTAYQELSMYLGNNMVVQKDPDVNISDELRAESHGFDKWSFRRHSDDSKKPRRK